MKITDIKITSITVPMVAPLRWSMGVGMGMNMSSFHPMATRQLWLMTGLLCLSGCATAPEGTTIRPVGPLIGEPQLLGSEPAESSFLLAVTTNNQGAERLEVKATIKGGPGEVFDLADGFGIGGRQKSRMWMGLCRVKKKRKHPIYIKLVWQRGSEKGVKRSVVTADQDDTSRQHENY